MMAKQAETCCETDVLNIDTQLEKADRFKNLKF